MGTKPGPRLSAALLSLDETQAQLDPLKSLRDWRVEQERKNRKTQGRPAPVVVPAAPAAPKLSAALRSLDETRAALDPLKDLREWRVGQEGKRTMRPEPTKGKVTLTPTDGARGGFDYEVHQDGKHLCYGWAAGTRTEARKEALEHASRTLRIREKIRASAVTGEPASGTEA
jgi:hypothetical protein